MQIIIIFSVFVLASLAVGVYAGLSQKGAPPTRVIVGVIATFAAFVVFYTIVFPLIGSWLVRQLTP